MKLKILHFNDVHSRYEELAKIGTAIESLKNDHTLIFDCGDNADFFREETEGTHGLINTAILNEIGINAQVYGNNEGFSGIENCKTMASHSNFPVLTSNMYYLSGEKCEFVKDTSIQTIAGLRILLIGITAPYNAFYELFKLNVKDPATELKRVLNNFKNTDYDLLIVLSHIGFKEDKKLVSEIPEINVIVGAHSHTILEKALIEDNTIICQAGCYGKYLGELILDINDETKKIQNFHENLIPSENYSPHPGISTIIASYRKKSDEYLTKELFKIDKPLKHSLTEETTLGNFFADALQDMLGTELGLINSGVFNNGIDAGPISKKLLVTTSPSPLNPTRIEVKGKDLLYTLEQSLDKEFQLMNGAGMGFRGKYLGNIQVSHNVKVFYNPNSENQKIQLIKVNEEALDYDKWYSVGTTDYLQRGTGYTYMGNARNESYLPEMLKEVLEIYLAKKEFIEEAYQNRFETIQ